MGLAGGARVWQAVAWGRWVNPCSMFTTDASGMVLAQLLPDEYTLGALHECSSKWKVPGHLIQVLWRTAIA